MNYKESRLRYDELKKSRVRRQRIIKLSMYALRFMCICSVCLVGYFVANIVLDRNFETIDANENSTNATNSVELATSASTLGIADQLQTVVQSVHKLEPVTESQSLTGTEAATEQQSEEATTKKASGIKYLFVGDSRFVGMSYLKEKGDSFIAKNGVGYSFLSANAEYISTIVDENTALIIGLGVNDYAASYQNYYNKINQLADELPCKVYYLKINPVEEKKGEAYGYTVYNSMIEKYNDMIVSKLDSNITVIDTYTYLMEDGYNTTDGLHYDNETYAKIYNYVKSNID